MNLFLTPDQLESQQRFSDFAKSNITPFAAKIDSSQKIDNKIIEKIALEGYMGAVVSGNFNGVGMDMITFGLLSKEIGKSCTSVRSLITVQNMVAGLIERWASDELKQQWLPSLVSGKKIAAFALTEPDTGSDANHIQSSVKYEGDTIIINGHKKWISFGQIADLFLTIGQFEGKLCTMLIEKDNPGVSIKPINNIMGVRGSMLAEVIFNDCRVPMSNQIGGAGFGLNPVGFSALDLGRYSIACGCIGMAEACFESSIAYSDNREQFGVKIKDHQLIKRLVSNMTTDIEAAQLLCYKAGMLKEKNDIGATKAVMIAKYFSTNMAVRVIKNAMRIHGANGFSSNYILERFYRDAEIMTVIEGSNQMMQLMISKYAYL